MKTQNTFRERLSIDLAAHPDVAKMLDRAEMDTKRSRTSLVVECIREALPGLIGSRARVLAETYGASPAGGVNSKPAVGPAVESAAQKTARAALKGLSPKPSTDESTAPASPPAKGGRKKKGGLQ